MKKAFAFLVLGMTLASCGEGSQSGLPAASNEFAVQTAVESDASVLTEYPATIKGQQDIEIRPKVSGFITRLCVDEGAYVHRGQPLFQIDRVQYLEAVKAAQAQINVINANINTQKLTVENKKMLLDKKIISDFDYQTAENQLKSLQAQLAQAQAQLASARDNLSFCTVVSPADGYVGTIPYRVGSLVSASTAQPLTTVSNISKMYVYFSMTEKDMLALSRESGGVNGAINAMPSVGLRLVDGSEYDVKGKVTTMSGVIDQNTGSLSMRATFDNPRKLLRSGGTATILFPTEVKKAIIVPQKCTYEIQDKKFVYVVGEDNKVHSREITVLSQNDGQNYIVTAGLKASERFVVDVVSTLKDGMEIKPITPEESDKNRKKAAEDLKNGKM